TTQTVTVQVSGDTLSETDENFFVDLGAPTLATIMKSRGVVTIANDDAVPSLSIDDIRLNEGNSGTAAATLTVKLSAPSAQPVTVNWSTADGTATAPSDYTSGKGTLTFDPGVTTQTVTVQVSGDTLNEADESFFVDLSAPTL